MTTVTISYFSDVLCVWAYFAQPRIDEVQRNFGASVQFDHRFCSVFGDTVLKIQTAWGAKGGYQGFSAHLHHSAEAFPEISLHPDLWLTVRPASSMAPHLVLKAVQLLENRGSAPTGSAEAAIRGMRRAFFETALDISQWAVQREVLQASGVDLIAAQDVIQDGRAYAALASDYQEAEALRLQGSPSFVLNEGRQKLYGNVGYRIIEANIQELLRAPQPDQASWC